MAPNFILAFVLDLLVAVIALTLLYPYVAQAMRPAMQFQPAVRAQPPQVLYINTSMRGSGKSIRDLEREGFVAAEGKLDNYVVMVKLNGRPESTARRSH